MSTMVIGTEPVRFGTARVGARTQAGTRPALRLTRRGRAVVSILALVLALVVTAVAQRADADGPMGGMPVEVHVVQPGETMWALAEQVARPGQDVRDVVLDLVRLNQLPGAGLTAGESILLPAS